MISPYVLGAGLILSLYSIPSAAKAEYALGVVEIFDRACVPYFVDNQIPSKSGLQNLTALERASTLYDDEAYDDLIWVDPNFDGVAFFIVPDEGCSVSGWVSEPSVVVEEVRLLADRLGAVPARSAFDEIAVIRERGSAFATYCFDVQDAPAARLSATIGREGERWGAVVRMLEHPTCQPHQSGDNS